MNKEEKTDLLQDLMNHLSRADKAYSLEGPRMMTIKQPDNTWRNRELFGTEFLPHGAYLGQKEAIFTFTPEDPQKDVATVEVKDRLMDETFALFLDDAKEWALKRFIPGSASRIKSIEGVQTVKDLIAICFSMEEEDMKQAEVVDDSAMASLPTFGMF